ncbi:cytoplasmic tRNA 2-thiolation protein 2 isoform X2 [Ambystoma mexicanum]|uniref:cytoplasmic tRNA 2-thiolation protein 2 isoform X2 n=1 Tax=Ambystoma mexicanum TaxID=8296 RepID=UPI0037E9493A
MCQVHDEEGGQYYPELQDQQPTVSPAQKCMKCKEGSAVLLIRAGDAFCRDCFKEYFIHKFRAMLGKNRLIYPGEKVLLALSGGPASSSMVQQVQEGLSRAASKKLRFAPGIVHVDEGAILGQSLEVRKQTTSQMKSVLKSSGFPYHIVPLEEAFNLPGSVLKFNSPEPRKNYKEAVDGFIINQQSLNSTKDEEWTSLVQERLDHLSTKDPEEPNRNDTLLHTTKDLPLSSMHTQTLINLFNSVSTLTAKEELLHTLRTHLILHTARTHGYAKVMVGDSCTRLAIKSMTNLSLGRGAFLATDTGFSDDRHGDVVVVRPMRDYSLKEISYYNRMFGVQTVFIPALDTKASSKASVHRLTEDFMTKLQADFPSTVSTVYRTSEKLTINPREASSNTIPADQCLFCMCSLDTHFEEASAFHATLVSERFSQRPTPALSPAVEQCCMNPLEEAEHCGILSKSCGSSPRADVKSVFLKLLCYGCRLTVKDMTSLESLPPYILLQAEQRNHWSEMKKEIQEFLLSDDESSDPPQT